MTTTFTGQARSTLLLLGILTFAALLAAPSCDVNITVQFDLFELLFGSADLLESPS